MRIIRGLPVPTRIGSGDCTGFGLERRVADREVRAVERHPVLAEQAVDDLDALLEAVDALLRRGQVEAVGVVLVDLPAGADAEHGAAAGDVVDGHHPLGRAAPGGGR